MAVGRHLCCRGRPQRQAQHWVRPPVLLAAAAQERLPGRQWDGVLRLAVVGEHISLGRWVRHRLPPLVAVVGEGVPARLVMVVLLSRGQTRLVA